MTTITDLLGAELQRLADALAPHDVPVIIGGGYGLLLRQQHALASGARTLLPIPDSRSTNDLDVFLTVELVADAEKMAALGRTLDELGFEVIDSAKYYQFARVVAYRGGEQSLKVDLLAPPPRPGTALRQMVRVDARRVRPRARDGAAPPVHAHTTPEAFTISEHTLTLPLGQGGTDVLVPHPYTFLLLKLFAYRDRREDPSKDFGQYHAYDLYRIVAMMTEVDYEQAQELRDRYADDEVVVEACGIVSALFSGADSEGALALLEHARTAQTDIAHENVETFASALADLLPPVP